MQHMCSDMCVTMWTDERGIQSYSGQLWQLFKAVTTVPENAFTNIRQQASQGYCYFEANFTCSMFDISNMWSWYSEVCNSVDDKKIIIYQ